MFRLILISCMTVVVSAGLFNWKGIEETFHDFNVFEWDFYKKHVPKKFERNSNVCRTQECFKIAAELWESMNKYVDPCEDFYEYACGRWSINNPVPPTELSWDTLQKMRKEVHIRVRDLLEEKIQPDDILPVKQVKKYYKSCMNLQALEERGIKPLEAFLVENGGWPMVLEPGEWNPELTWQEVNQYYSRLIYSSAFYRIIVSTDYRESNSSTDDFENRERVIGILSPLLPSEIIRYTFRKIFNITDMYEDGTYAKYITEVALIFARERGADIDIEEIKVDVSEIIELEKKLQNITINFSSEAQYVSIEEVQEIYDFNTTRLSEKSNMDWKKIIISFFAGANVDLEGDELVQLFPSNHFEVLADILDNTDPRILVNYIHWNFVSRLLRFTTLKMEELQNELVKNREGIKEQSPRWENCIRTLTMSHAVAYQYVNKYFQDKMKDDVQGVFFKIQKEMIKHILKADWLSDEMRKVELEKIKKLRMNIGYPDWYNNVTALSNIYHGVVIGNQFFDNALSLQKYAARKWLRTLKTPFKMDDWFAHPLIVNAFYRPDKNSFNIPAADFQSPIYSLSQPNTVNYGELGMIISHEVAHGFDNHGIEYDQDGKKYKWSEDIKKSYENRSKCYVDQYKNFYTYNESTSDNSTEKMGEISLSENLADSLGLEIVFGALEANEEESRSPRLPGFEDWNNEKLFFLSFAKLWCTSRTPEYEKLLEKYHVHSKPNYRVNAPVQNSEEFARVFKCPVGSPMNPEIKCKIW